MIGRLLIWAVAEVLLSLVGVDDLADYSEFLWEKNPSKLISQNIGVK